MMGLHQVVIQMVQYIYKGFCMKIIHRHDFLSDLLTLNEQHCGVESPVYWGIMSLYMVLCAHRGDLTGEGCG